MRIRSSVLTLLLLSSSVFANDGSGLITVVGFFGEKFTSHPDVVQFEIKGGFKNTSCNTQFAAVKKSDSHLVSALLAAKMSGNSVQVYLDPANAYYDNGNDTKRCTTSFLLLNEK